MTDHLPVTLAERYPTVTTRAVKGSPRIDVEVGPTDVITAAAEPDLTARLRWFFAEMDAEVDRVSDDPIALTNALARVETLLADLRYMSKRIKDATAAALDAGKVRRLTVSNVATIEATSAIERTEWQTPALMSIVLEHLGTLFVDSATGEIQDRAVVADRLGEFFRAEWRLTPLRDIGVDPDQFCTIARDADGNVKRTPTVKIVDNAIRSNSTVL